MNYIMDSIISWFIFLFGVAAPFYLILGAIGIGGFREITKYEAHDSFYYRLNPAIKIVFSVAVMIIASMMIWWIGAVLALGILASYASLKNGRRKVFIGSMFLISIIIGTTWSYAPLTPPSILFEALRSQNLLNLWKWPSYFAVMGYQPYLTLQGLIYGMQISFRFAAVTIAALILVMTTTPSQILKALHKLRIPDPIVFSLMVAMKSVPMVFQSLDASVKMQMLRGLGSGRRKFLKPIFLLIAGISAIVPTIVHLMRGAKDIAISADTRGFRAYNHRTYFVDIPMTRTDYYMLAVFLAGVGVAGIMLALGFGRAIPYIS
ncbi:MAG: energy-coupling factor transporter transmembrane protein EcfT [Candidatus Thermoplasmatota archaeon]|nr:energy-coupling factor transporter transmembrane protein EcfT [Candidatus Thermoplasmatota archaeon]